MLTTLPLRAPLGLVTRITAATAALLGAVSVAGLVYGRRGWYEIDPVTLPAFVGQDVATLVIGLPLLLGSARAARHGSVRGLLCWSGALFYAAYSYFFFVIGGGLSPLFPAYVAIVSLAMYGTLGLVFAIDHAGLASRFDRNTPVRLVSGYLIATSLFFAVLWLAMIVAALVRGSPLTIVQRTVIAVDAVVLLPLLCYAGLALWRRQPIGYCLAGLLLVKAAATFATLLIATWFVAAGGTAVQAGETAAYAAGLAGAAILGAAYFRHIVAPPPASTWRISLWQEEP